MRTLLSAIDRAHDPGEHAGAAAAAQRKRRRDRDRRKAPSRQPAAAPHATSSEAQVRPLVGRSRSPKSRKKRVMPTASAGEPAEVARRLGPEARPVGGPGRGPRDRDAHRQALGAARRRDPDRGQQELRVGREPERRRRRSAQARRGGHGRRGHRESARVLPQPRHPGARQDRALAVGARRRALHPHLRDRRGQLHRRRTPRAAKRA